MWLINNMKGGAERWLLKWRGTAVLSGYNKKTSTSLRTIKKVENNLRLRGMMACGTSRQLCISMPKYSKGEVLSRYSYDDDYIFNKGRREHKGKPSLVIFDKDGTLICLHAMWSWWIEPFADCLSDSLGYPIHENLFQAIKYDTISKTVSNHSVVAQATNANVRKTILQVIMETGVTEGKADDILDRAWEQEVIAKHPPLVDCIKPVGNVKSLFQALKEDGIKIAVCTSDCRDATIATLELINCLDIVDTIICGDDDINVQKPAPDNALNICQALNVNPIDTVVIGDTTADVIMGRRAKLGLVVGVLSGAGQECDLQPYTDYVVKDIHDLLPLLLKTD